MANVNPTPVAPVEASLPAYSASGVPVTRPYRVAFQIWVICFLLTIVVTLVFYLIDKLSLALGGS